MRSHGLINYHSWEADALFLLFAAVVALIIIAHSILEARRGRKPSWRVPTLPVNRKNLRSIGYVRGLLIWFVYLPMVVIVAAACWLGGRMNLTAALGTVAVLWISPLVYIFQILRLQYPPLRRALADREFDRELKGKTLLFLHGAWQYADADWFIRVNNDYSAALCARWIDFEKPVRFRMRDEWIRAAFGRGTSSQRLYCPLLCFTGRDGSEITARLDCTPDVVKWVERHGGKIIS